MYLCGYCGVTNNGICGLYTMRDGDATPIKCCDSFLFLVSGVRPMAI